MKFWGLVALALAMSILASQAMAQTRIPFVGCVEQGPSPDDDGWTAPSGRTLATNLPPTVASRLAVYASNWSAVLAPRGWACHSSFVEKQGVAMIVAPKLDGNMAAILAGPSVILWNDQNPRTVAAYAARYFPERVAPMTASTRANDPAQPMPRYPNDRLRYLSDLVLDYATPAHHAGLGEPDEAAAARQSLTSYGVLALSNLPQGAGGIVNLTVRLPADLTFLHGAIVKALAACLPNDNVVACESGGAFVEQGHPLDDGD
jgi:hypothetical protein